MGKKSWSKNHEKCLNCGTTKRKHHGLGYCTSCYNKIKLKGYRKRYYKENKERIKKQHKQYREANKEKKREIDRKYRETHKKELAEYFHKRYLRIKSEKQKYDVQHRSEKRFDKLDMEVLKNAGLKCELCGLSNDEHIERYGCRLSVHHKDNKGRRNLKLNKKPNNETENLMVLCCSCRGKEDSKFQNYNDGRGYRGWETRRKKCLS